MEEEFYAGRPNGPSMLLNEIGDERINLDEGKKVEAKFVIALFEA